MPSLTGRGLRPEPPRLTRLRGQRAQALLAVSNLLQNRASIADDRRLGYLLHVVHEIRSRANAGRPILGPVDRVSAARTSRETLTHRMSEARCRRSLASTIIGLTMAPLRMPSA